MCPRGLSEELEAPRALWVRRRSFRVIFCVWEVGTRGRCLPQGRCKSKVGTRGEARGLGGLGVGLLGPCGWAAVPAVFPIPPPPFSLHLLYARCPPRCNAVTPWNEAVVPVYGDRK